MAGIYVHVPFCRSACPYCDYHFEVYNGDRSPFVRSLVEEIGFWGEKYGQEEPVETIYIGGGTPSVLSLEETASILSAVDNAFDTAMIEEITVEVNPEDGDRDYFAGLRSLNVNRLSIGVQSFFEDDLQMLGRSHTSEQAEMAIQNAYDADIHNVSIDLLFGIPEQPMEYWAANLERAIKKGVPHISTYTLTVEKGTGIYDRIVAGEIVASNSQIRSEHFELAIDYLIPSGYEHYEMSSFCRSGFRSKHNESYWQHKNYIGVGPSAHSFWKESGVESRAMRWTNVSNLGRYTELIRQREHPVLSTRQLTLDELADEYIMFCLRTLDGINLDRLENGFGIDLLMDKVNELAWLESEGFIAPIRNSKILLTDRGKLWADAVQAKLID